MVKYVLGFAFDSGSDPNVGLIRKKRPTWQAGFLNGVGGHVEDGETPHEAMVREFQEETGLFVPTWAGVATMKNDEWEVVVFKAFGVPLQNMVSLTDEKVAVYPADCLPYDVLFNLRWLIPLALDPQPLPFFEVPYPDAY
jgi:8-oxo-dGTP diphosphatase